MSDPHSGGPVTQPHPTHLDNTFSYHGYVTSTPMLDGHLLARPLVLDEVQPATLRASTSMSRQTKSSVMRPSDRCPPAACPRSGTGVWPGGDGSSAAALPSHPSQTPRIHEPPIAVASALPPVSAHVGYNSHTRAAEHPPVGPQVTPTDQARICREGTCLGRLGSESRRRDPHSRESPPRDKV